MPQGEQTTRDPFQDHGRFSPDLSPPGRVVTQPEAAEQAQPHSPQSISHDELARAVVYLSAKVRDMEARQDAGGMSRIPDAVVAPPVSGGPMELLVHMHDWLVKHGMPVFTLQQ